MNIYVAGPMRGIKDFNFPLFHEIATRLRKQGHMVFNPAERDEMVYGTDIGKSETGDLKEAAAKGFDHREAMAADCQWIARNADAICLLPGWERSSGAAAELALARCLGLKVLYVEPNGFSILPSE